MKKLSVIILILFLLPITTHAEELTISDLKLVSNSNTAGVLTEPEIDNLNINFDFSFKNTNDIIKYSFIVHNISEEEYEIKLTDNNNKNINYELSTNKINKNGDTYIEIEAKYIEKNNLSSDRHEDSSVNISLLNMVNNNQIDTKILYGLIGAILIGFSFLILKLNKKLFVLIPIAGAMMFIGIPATMSKPLITINTNVTLLKNHYCNSFSEDDWTQISHNINNDNASCYNIGDTKEIVIKDIGTFNIRIVNKTECNANDNESSCGFVLEFTDSIIQMKMNDNEENETGWDNSAVRKYLNDTIYNKVPENLRTMIIDTNITTEETKTTDKLYLPSKNDLVLNDENTKVLEYYMNNQVFTKTYNDEIVSTWTRDKYPNMKYYGSIVEGLFDYNEETSEYGVSPLFRIK